MFFGYIILSCIDMIDSNFCAGALYYNIYLWSIYAEE